MRFLPVLAGVALVLSGCGSEEPAKPSAAPAAAPVKGQPMEEKPEKPMMGSAKEAKKVEPASPMQPKEVVTASGLKYVDLVEGSGPAAKAGDSLEMHYTGWLTNGTKFDSSLDRGQTFAFTLGAHQVIAGWDEGVAGMKAGGKRKLTIPSALGYGARGAGGVIPPNATLVFEVQLVRIR